MKDYTVISLLISVSLLSCQINIADLNLEKAQHIIIEESWQEDAALEASLNDLNAAVKEAFSTAHKKMSIRIGKESEPNSILLGG